MRKYTFRGGFHVEEYKNTAASPVKRLPPQKQVSIPLLQHIGAPCEPCVKVGDEVLRGQMIGDVKAGLGCPVHSSVSGKVVALKSSANVAGVKVTHVVIENDLADRAVEEIRESGRTLDDADAETVVEVARAAGIAGMGGATFPTHVKIKGAVGRVDTMIINAAECEPYITANNRLILEQPESVISGARILTRALGIKTAIIAVEDNKPEAIQILQRLTADLPELSVRVVKTKYPQGDERQLIFALTGTELPQGKLPADVGCIIFNVETVAAIHQAFFFGKPLCERIVTVDGDCVRTPGNFLVPIGTPFSALIEACGGLTCTPERIIAGGPMMGMAQWDADAPVTKGTSAILVLRHDASAEGAAECIRCGRCVGACPMHLMPNYIAAFSRKNDYEHAERFGAKNCVECGTCAYVCPARVPIVQYIRAAKFNINARNAARK